MDAQAVLEKRLIDLELKATEAEDLLDHLNQLVYRQQQQIEAMARELLHLRQQQGGDGPAGSRTAQDERPPHY
ncbi:SlyX family protein [Castellaniella sp.]|uniref:SlyX family protein n=1 Tax=Castellaniella sp. TaxID=1955812 RepID=UPI002AFDFC7E|nr:SlyX family protein [Castellaniella sp.]